ncbi:MAG: hypothetical protein FWF70_06715 [Bacteroidetes bacterium]|nr:hypothetical protein [Bacteroidota bacterium]MCL1969198.1 hypothetical protein [Bacteroidota bacterium]
MKKYFPFLFFVVMLVAGCKQPIDTVVAEAFHNKLYLSEVIEKIPSLASKEDSLQFMEQYVEEWILRQTLLAQAKRKLSQKAQNFSSQIEQYQEQLLINAYFQKISNNAALFEVSKKELDEFLNETQTDDVPKYRDMVKLNYVKLSNPSKLYRKIKNLFFDDTDRAKSLVQIEQLCADTIEYYLDSEHWFYVDLIERDFPFSLSDLITNNSREKIDIVANENRYLILILDKKQQMQHRNVLEDKKMAQSLIQQQKRDMFITNYQDSLLKDALLNKKAVRYLIH